MKTKEEQAKYYKKWYAENRWKKIDYQQEYFKNFKFSKKAHLLSKQIDIQIKKDEKEAIISIFTDGIRNKKMIMELLEMYKKLDV